MRKARQARQIRSHSVTKQNMAEFGTKLYFRVAFLALLLPLASGELSIISVQCIKRSSRFGSNYWSLYKRDLCSDSSAMEVKHDFALNKRDHTAKS